MCDAKDMLSDVGHLEVGIVGGDAVVECLLVMLQLAAKVSHPVDVELTCAHIERPWVKALAERLALDQSVEDAVHWHLCLEFLVRCSDASDQVLTQSSGFTITTSRRLLNRSLVLEGPTRRAIAKLAVPVILEEVCLAVLAFDTLIIDLGCPLPLLWLSLFLCGLLRRRRETDGGR